MRLSVHLDGLMMLRSVRGGRDPDPVALAVRAESGGADGISVALSSRGAASTGRDLRMLRAMVRGCLNIEVSPFGPRLDDLAWVQPDQVTLVPEDALTGAMAPALDLTETASAIAPVAARLLDAGIRVVAFVAADPEQVLAAADAGLDGIELDTAPYARMVLRPGWTPPDEVEALLEGRFLKGGGHPAHALGQLASAASVAADRGLAVAAGRGLGLAALPALASVPGLEEVHVGHAVLVRALETGMESAVREVLGLLRRG
ncbi:MAG: pyridoxine 5'-phosphate synthase [Candidatus Sericytochromatia bacterium]|nr:pyridoxine 5'-phosphate synthase [Candidatus Sericytochromatia bacterium]